jgi:hypothetical protein
MLRVVGFLVLFILAVVGAYTLYNSNEKEVRKGKEKIRSVYKAVRNELQK